MTKDTIEKTGLFRHHTWKCCRQCNSQGPRPGFVEMSDTHKQTWLCLDCFKKMTMKKMKKSGNKMQAL